MKLEIRPNRQGQAWSEDLGFLQAPEREKVLEVLQRDRTLRNVEAERVRRLRAELGVCHQGGRSPGRVSGRGLCARCQRLLGKLWACGSVCGGCSQRVCARCQVIRPAGDWHCTLCHTYREFKIKSGEWFLEQQVKKFSDEENGHESAGEKLLHSHQQLSFISVVPPTPPPVTKDPSYGKLQDTRKPKAFTRSMENLMVSVGAQIRKLSKSQNDLSKDTSHLTVKSQSESAIAGAHKLCKAPSLPTLSRSDRKKKCRTSSSSMNLTDDDTSYTSDESRIRSTERASRYAGEMELALDYSLATSCLEITIKSCRNLPCADQTKTCRSFVRVRLLPKRRRKCQMKTKVKSGTNPVYNQTFTCAVCPEQLSSSVVEVSVWHSRGLKHKLLLGETSIRLDTHTSSSAYYTLTARVFQLEHSKSQASRVGP